MKLSLKFRKNIKTTLDECMKYLQIVELWNMTGERASSSEMSGEACEVVSVFFFEK